MTQSKAHGEIYFLNDLIYSLLTDHRKHNAFCMMCSHTQDYPTDLEKKHKFKYVKCGECLRTSVERKDLLLNHLCSVIRQKVPSSEFKALLTKTKIKELSPGKFVYSNTNLGD